MTLLGLLPLVVYLLCAGCFFVYSGRVSPRRSLRDCLLAAAVSSGSWVVMGTEILSPWCALRFYWILLWWCSPAVVLAVLVYRKRNEIAPALRSALPESRSDRLLLLTGASIAALVAIPAWLSPPNNWDALSYHLPRQVYWIQHGTVAHFAAYDLRLINMPPFVEYVSAHLMILSGGDRWTNLVQWFAWILTMGAVSLIARELGGRTREQILAALLVATIPIACLEASNPKNDLVVSLWVCILARSGFKIWSDRSCSVLQTLLIGASVGLLILTKGTGMLFALPLCLFVVSASCVLPRARAASLGAMALVVCLAMNLGFFSRNLSLFGSITGPTRGNEGGIPVVNETFSTRAFLANLVRNSLLHLGTPSESLNRKLTLKIESWAERLGLDLNDPRTTFPPWGHFKVEHFPYLEDTAPAPLHFLLSLLLPVMLLARKDPRRDFRIWVYLGVSFAGFALFCWVFKWQLWHARLQLPLFCLFCAAIAILVERFRGSILVVCAAVVIVLPSILFNESKPLIGAGNVWVSSKADLFFRQRSEAVKASTFSVVEYVQSLRARTVGFRLVSGWDSVYFFQKLFLSRMSPPPRFTEFNPIWAKPATQFDLLPDLVVATNTYSNKLIHEQSLTPFYPIAEFHPFRIYSARLDAAESQDPSRFAFTGWDNSDGLEPEEGPYPQLDLPLLRWGTGNRTSLHFQGEGKEAMLVIEARTEHSNQEMTVSLNGTIVYQSRFPALHVFLPIQIPTAGVQAANELVFQYSISRKADDRFLAVMFRKLQILPLPRP